MNKIYGTLLIGLLIIGCKEKTIDNHVTTGKVEFNQELADELKQMAKIDQVAAYVRRGEYEKMTDKEWDSFQDSVFTTNQKRVKEIFDQYGFVGFDLAGNQGSDHFWLIVQHSDHNPEFQKEVLEKMEVEVKKENASPRKYGLLVDRVRLNTGQKQVYGTQVAYNPETGQAYPKSLEDSINVNEKRKSLGFEPLEEYLNGMTQMHFEMNKLHYQAKGISEPKLYKTE